MTRAAFVAGVIALAAALYFARHRGSHAETTSSAAPEEQRASMPSVSPTAAPRLANAAPVESPTVEHANTDGLPEVLEPGYLAVEHAAKTCLRRPLKQAIRPNGPDETIESIQLEYRQVVSHGVGHVEDLKVIDGKLTDEALQSCIVKVAAAATWSSAAPDGEIGSLQQNVTLGDLLRPDHGLPPPSQRSPKPMGPPPPELAGPLGHQAPEIEDEHPGVVVSDPSLAKRPK